VRGIESGGASERTWWVEADSMEPVENSAQENYKISDKKATCLLRTKVVEVQNKKSRNATV